MGRKAFFSACAFFLSFFLALLFSVQSASAAAFTKTLCNPGSETITSPIQITDAASFNASVQSFKGSTNLCTNDKLTMSIVMTGLFSGHAVFTDVSTCICPKPAPPDAAKEQQVLNSVGCAKGQTQPTVTFDLSAHNDSCTASTFTISKCASDPVATFKAACAGADMSIVNPTQAAPSSAPAPSANPPGPATAPVPPAQVPSPGAAVAGNDQLVSALTASGISASDAQRIASDPASAQALINAYATGNKDTIQDTVQDAAEKAGLNLNGAVYDNISSLSATDLQNAKEALSPLADSSGTYIATDTFAPSSDASRPSGTSLTDGNVCGYPGIGGMMMNPETKCGSIQAPAGQSAQGPLQYQCTTWQAYTAATGHSDWSDCSNRYDAAKAVQVTNDYYQNVWLPQNAASCAAANISLPSCAYTSHWLGTGGGPALVKALPGLDMSAPITSLCGSAYLSQAACDQNPGLIYADSRNRSQPYTIAGVFQHMDSLLGVSSSAPTTYQGAPASGPFGSLLGSGASVDPTLSNAGAVSPFASVSGVSGTSIGAPGYSQITPSSGYVPPASTPYYPSQPYQVAQQSNSAAPSAGSAASALPLPAATAQIIAQPHTASRGSTVVVAWTSAGIAASACNVFENSTALMVSTNAGTLSVQASSTGPLSFTLSCKSAATGLTVTSSDSVVIK